MKHFVYRASLIYHVYFIYLSCILCVSERNYILEIQHFINNLFYYYHNILQQFQFDFFWKNSLETYLCCSLLFPVQCAWYKMCLHQTYLFHSSPQWSQTHRSTSTTLCRHLSSWHHADMDSMNSHLPLKQNFNVVFGQNVTGQHQYTSKLVF